MSLFVDDHRGADLSPCGTYRYKLWRTWNPSIAPVCFIMLNPSTADATDDDRTISKCIKYARRWGAGGLVVANLYAYRATDPRGLLSAPDPVGPHNDAAIRDIASIPGRIIAAWGAHTGIDARVAHVRTLLAARTLEALRITKDGAPGHPLYLLDAVDPVIYS